MVGLAQQSGGSADSERRTLGAWNGLVQATPNGRVPQKGGIPGTQEAQAWSIALIGQKGARNMRRTWS